MLRDLQGLFQKGDFLIQALGVVLPLRFPCPTVVPVFSAAIATLSQAPQ